MLELPLRDFDHSGHCRPSAQYDEQDPVHRKTSHGTFKGTKNCRFEVGGNPLLMDNE